MYDGGMRTTEDLINEVAEYGSGTLAILVVSFQESDHHRVEYIASTDTTGQLAKLDEMVRRGGRPMGMIRHVRVSATQGHLELRPLQEYADNRAACDFLERVRAAYSREREAAGWIKVLPGEN